MESCGFSRRFWVILRGRHAERRAGRCESRPIVNGGGGTNVALSHGMNSAAPWTSNPADYSAAIVAASVHAGTYQRPVRRWVQTHQMALNQRPTAFVSVCLAVLNRTPKVVRDLEANLQRFFDETGWKPEESKVVAGALHCRLVTK